MELQFLYVTSYIPKLFIKAQPILPGRKDLSAFRVSKLLTVSTSTISVKSFGMQN